MRREWTLFKGDETLRPMVAAYCKVMRIKYEDLGDRLNLWVNWKEATAIGDYIVETA